MIVKTLAAAITSLCLAGAASAQGGGRPAPVGFTLTTVYSEISNLKSQLGSLQQQVSQLKSQNAGLSQQIADLDGRFKGHTHTYKMTTFGFADGKLSHPHIGFDGVDEPTTKPN